MLSHGFVKSLRKKCPEESFLEAVAQWMGRRLGVGQRGNAIDLIRTQHLDGTRKHGQNLRPSTRPVRIEATDAMHEIILGL